MIRLKHGYGLLALVLIFILVNCGDDDNGNDISTSENGNGVEFPDEKLNVLPGLPDDVAAYQKWLKLNDQPIPPLEGADPHRGTKNVYLNRERAVIVINGQQQFPYPDGAIIVKESIPPGEDFIGLIAIMRKMQGSNPDHNDWTFVEYTRNDSDEAFQKIASGASCWGCHSEAVDTDYVFTLLE
ncbi:cytochrome P460 family protein [bacterium]|nr:cytochrome P460 family protein [bacterium]